MSQLGLLLRDAALRQSAAGRQAAIEAVRDYIRGRMPVYRVIDYARGVEPPALTGDDVMEAVEALGLGEGDHRWVGNVLKGWNAVTPTAHFTPSRRPERHGAPLRVWRWRA